MKRGLLFLTILMCSITATFAQHKSDFLVGVNSNLANVKLLDVTLNPSVVFGLTDHIFVGGSLTTESWGLIGRLYAYDFANSRAFGQVEYTNTNTDNVVARIGVTGLMGKWLYVEPSLYYNFVGNKDYGLTIGFGVRI